MNNAQYSNLRADIRSIRDQLAQPSMPQRDYFALVIMAHLVTSSAAPSTVDGCVQWAVKYADALIEALNKEPK